jgi:hypothetical protein
VIRWFSKEVMSMFYIDEIHFFKHSTRGFELLDRDSYSCWQLTNETNGVSYVSKVFLINLLKPDCKIAVKKKIAR